MAKMVKLVETKQSGFYFVILFLAIILSSLANITLPGQNIDKKSGILLFSYVEVTRRKNGA